MPLIRGLQDEAALIADAANVAPIEDWDDEQLQSFLYELIDIGITTAKQHQQRFTFVSSDRKPYQDFAWYYYWEILDLADELTALKGLIVDWQSTWDCYLSGRFECFRFEGKVYFYKQADYAKDSD